jgi:hypothetical protein
MNTRYRPLLLLAALALAACDGGAGPDLRSGASVGLPSEDAELSARTFCSGGETNTSFYIDREVTIPDGVFHVTGRLHVVLDVEHDGNGGFDVGAHANAQGLSAEHSGDTFLITGAANVDVEVGATGTTEVELEFNVITPGPDPNYDLFITLALSASNGGQCLDVEVTEIRAEER